METTTTRAQNVQSVVNLLIQSARLHHRNADRRTSMLGVNRSPGLVLLCLANSRNIPSQRELADHFDISPACVARTLKSLVSDGYVLREGDEDDQRRNNVYITDKGMEVVEQIRGQFRELEEIAFEEVSDAELEMLQSVLQRVVTRLHRLETEEVHTQKGASNR